MNSLETRAPLLDHRVLEWVARLPFGYKQRNGVSKWVLRECVRPLLPSAILARGKQGFGVPLDRWFAGDFSEVAGHVATYFWPMPVEDNAFMSLRTSTGVTAWLHASWTEWKNTFSFEIFGRDGKLQIDGLGGSYGAERLTHYRMLPELG